MSEVISFRLDPKNPREANALRLLQQRINQGYTYRQIITDALLNHDCSQRDLLIMSTTSSDILNQLRELNELLKNVSHEKTIKFDRDCQENSLNEKLIQSIHKVAQPGMKYTC